MNFQTEFEEFVSAKDRMAKIVDSDHFQADMHAYADFMTEAHAYDFATDQIFSVSHGFGGTHPSVLKFGIWTLEQEYSDASTLVVQQCVGVEVEVVGIPVAWFFDREAFCASVRKDMKGNVRDESIRGESSSQGA